MVRPTLAALMALMLLGCGKTEPPASSQSTHPSPSPVAAEEPPQPVAPAHYYSIAENGEYGYEVGLSDDDRHAGKVAAPLMMVRYLGEKDGIYTVAMPAGGGVVNAFSCRPPCEFIKSQIKVNGQVVKTETMRNPGNAVVSAVMLDAINGKLTQYRVKRPQ